MYRSSIWEKCCFWDTGQNALSHSDCEIFKSSISFCMLIQVDWKVFWWDMVKNECGQFGLWTLKLTVSQERADGVNWLFACWYVVTKIKSWSKTFLGGHGQKWVWPVWSWYSKMSRWNKVIFSCCYEFRKAKSWFKYFWVGMVKNSHVFLVHEALKSVVP